MSLTGPAGRSGGRTSVSLTGPACRNGGRTSGSPPGAPSRLPLVVAGYQKAEPGALKNIDYRS